MPITYILVSIGLILTTGNLLSQVNTESMLPNADKSGFGFNINATAGLNQGNSEFALFNASTRLDYTSDSSFTSFIVGNLDYREGNESKIAHSGFAHLRFIKHLTSIIFPEAFVQKQFNSFTNLLDRNLFGVGTRFNFINSEGQPDSVIHTDFMMGIGVMYEKEVLRDPNRYTTEIPRSTNYLNFTLKVPDGINISSVIYYQPSLVVFSDWRMMSTFNMSFPLYKQLSFLVSLNFNYDNEPPVGIEKYDLELRNGISFTL